MKDFLKYPSDKLQLLQKIYRHKIVHLSQPKSAMEYNNQIIAWRHDENDPSKHLTIDPTPGIGDIYGKVKIQCDGLENEISSDYNSFASINVCKTRVKV